MNTIDYFKLQAKNLYKDFKTQKPYFDPSLVDNLYEYSPKFFDVDALVTDFDIDEENFTLMNAQHIIVKLAGFQKWGEMLKASPSSLELSKLLFDNMHKIEIVDWNSYVSDIENKNGVTLDDEFKLDLFKQVFVEEGDQQIIIDDYRLIKTEKPLNENQITKPTKKIMENKNPLQISALPLTGADRKEFIEIANEKFEDIMATIEPDHPELTRKSWNPEKYVDEVIRPDMLPIDREYALSITEDFLVHHVIGLAAEADDQAIGLN